MFSTGQTEEAQRCFFRSIKTAGLGFGWRNRHFNTEEETAAANYFLNEVLWLFHQKTATKTDN